MLCPMAEWLISLFLAPASFVPAVLLIAFAGCTIDPRARAPVPTIVSAIGKSISTDILTWMFPNRRRRLNSKQKAAGDDHGEFRYEPGDWSTHALSSTFA